MTQELRERVGQLVKHAMDAKNCQQGAVAKIIGKSPTYMSRLVHGRSTVKVDRDVIVAIENALNRAELSGRKDSSRTVIVEEFDRLMSTYHDRAYDIYVSSPLTGLVDQKEEPGIVGRSSDETLAEANSKVGEIVTYLISLGYRVFWPGENITSVTHLKKPHTTTYENLKVLLVTDGFLYIQLNEVIRPTGALIELGIALGRRIKTTLLLSPGVTLPFMLRGGFEKNMERFPEFPDAQVDEVDSVSDIKTRIANTGPAYFGLDETLLVARASANVFLEP